MIEWSPSLAVGITTIDAQHQELVRAFNALEGAMEHGKGTDRVLPTLRFLGEYAVKHFGTEEHLMRLHAYPGYAEHRAAHEAFKNDFARLLKETETTQLRVAKTMEVSRKLLDWLFTHIKRMDREMAAHLAARGER
jgi:hemerythrin